MERKLAFTFNGRNLEARATIKKDKIKVSVYEDDRRVTPRTYMVTTSTDKEAFNDEATIEYNTRGLLELVRQEVESGKMPLDNR